MLEGVVPSTCKPCRRTIEPGLEWSEAFVFYFGFVFRELSI